MDVCRRTYHFAGHVQGVGFRYTARSIASTAPVSGYVRNLADGRVEMVIEGAPAEIDRVIETLRGRMSENIRDVKMNEEPPRGDLAGFIVKH